MITFRMEPKLVKKDGKHNERALLKRFAVSLVVLNITSLFGHPVRNCCLDTHLKILIYLRRIILMQQTV